jgi:hypothetical protein
MDKELYDKYLNAMRRSYEVVAEDIDPDDLNDDELMLEIVTDADRMFTLGGLTWEEQKWFYNNVPHNVCVEMFHKIK